MVGLRPKRRQKSKIRQNKLMVCVSRCDAGIMHCDFTKPGSLITAEVVQSTGSNDAEYYKNTKKDNEN